MTFNVLIPDNVAEEAVNLLNKASGFNVSAPGKLSKEEILPVIEDVHALIIRSGVKPDAEIFEAAKNLKAIARAGVGTDNIDKEAATKHGVIVMNTPGGNTISTAEHAFGLMLALARHIPKAHATMQEGRWDRKLYKGHELRGSTLGIVGFGRIGQAIARRARAFEMNTVAFDPFLPRDHPAIDDTRTPLVSLDKVYAQANIITLHPALTDDTKGMINSEAIAKMKDGVMIINAARGALINDADLAEALKSGKVGGVALDVYDPEPPTGDNPLIGLDNVVHTPHLAASTYEAQVAVAMEAAEQIKDGLTEGDWRNVVNPEVFMFNEQ